MAILFLNTNMFRIKADYLPFRLYSALIPLHTVKQKWFSISILIAWQLLNAISLSGLRWKLMLLSYINWGILLVTLDYNIVTWFWTFIRRLASHIGLWICQLMLLVLMHRIIDIGTILSVISINLLLLIT